MKKICLKKPFFYPFGIIGNLCNFTDVCNACVAERVNMLVNFLFLFYARIRKYAFVDSTAVPDPRGWGAYAPVFLAEK